MNQVGNFMVGSFTVELAILWMLLLKPLCVFLVDKHSINSCCHVNNSVNASLDHKVGDWSDWHDNCCNINNCCSTSRRTVGSTPSDNIEGVDSVRNWSTAHVERRCISLSKISKYRLSNSMVSGNPSCWTRPQIPPPWVAGPMSDNLKILSSRSLCEFRFARLNLIHRPCSRQWISPLLSIFLLNNGVDVIKIHHSYLLWIQSCPINTMFV